MAKRYREKQFAGKSYKFVQKRKFLFDGKEPHINFVCFFSLGVLYVRSNKKGFHFPRAASVCARSERPLWRFNHAIKNLTPLLATLHR